MACDACVDLILPDPRLVEPVSVSSTTFGAVTSSSFAFHHNPLLRSCGTVTSGVTVPPKASEPFYENILFFAVLPSCSVHLDGRISQTSGFTHPRLVEPVSVSSTTIRS